MTSYAKQTKEVTKQTNLIAIWHKQKVGNWDKLLRLQHEARNSHWCRLNAFDDENIFIECMLTERRAPQPWTSIKVSAGPPEQFAHLIERLLRILCGTAPNIIAAVNWLSSK